MWYVYILKSDQKKFLYIGSTNDLRRRIAEHNSKQCESTKAYAPYSLESYIAVSTEYQARSLEKYFKTGSGRTILKIRILNNEDLAKHEVLSEA